MRPVSLCLDLGSDTLKIACVSNVNGNVVLSKIADDRYFEIAVPAIAHYDSNFGWRYGYEVGTHDEQTFATVVKIKDLISILNTNPDLPDDEEERIVNQNKPYYERECIFPEFDFPVTLDRKVPYWQFCTEQSFVSQRFVGSKTPKQVCEGYFKYVGGLIAQGLADILKRNAISLDTDTIVYTAICPSRMGQWYLDEYLRLIKLGLNLDSKVSVELLTSTKALGMLAYYNHALSDSGESVLLFDIGEEQISVVKFNYEKIKGKTVFSVDGVSGHSMPQKLGGNNIDKAVVDYLEEKISHRTSMGRVKGGSENEHGLKSKNYLFMKEVKAVKTILGEPDSAVRYPHGLPLEIIRELTIRTTLNHDEFLNCLTNKQYDNESKSVAQKITDYIANELVYNKSANENVQKIYLSGGVVGTYGLVEFIQNSLDNNAKITNKYKIQTFTDSLSNFVQDGQKGVRFSEVFAYAPALGGALIGYNGDKLSCILTRTYGMKFFAPDDTPIFGIFAERGSSLNFDVPGIAQDGGVVSDDLRSKCYFTSATSSPGRDGSEPVFIYSASLSQAQINARYYDKFGIKIYGEVDGVVHLKFNSNDSQEMQRWKSHLQLICETGNGNVQIKRYYKGQAVAVLETFFVLVGVKIDRDGMVTPYTDNDLVSNQIVYPDGVSIKFSDGRVISRVPVNDIEVKFDNIIDSFSSGSSNNS